MHVTRSKSGLAHAVGVGECPSGVRRNGSGTHVGV
jgi:hypothetical protein